LASGRKAPKDRRRGRAFRVPYVKYYTEMEEVRKNMCESFQIFFNFVSSYEWYVHGKNMCLVLVQQPILSLSSSTCLFSRHGNS
jgi:hypothetical protein